MFIKLALLAVPLFSSLHAFHVTRIETMVDSDEKSLKAMHIDFQMDETIDSWVFGFYMSITLNTLGNVNPDLEIQIFDKSDPSHVMPLHFIKKSESPAAYGNGTVQAFAPTQDFPLMQDKSYTVLFKNSNQLAPVSLTFVAQNFFLYDRQKTSFSNAIAPITAYGNTIDKLENIGGYNLTTLQEKIARKINDNWISSAPLIPGDLSDQYHLIPSPQSISALDSPVTTLQNTTAFYSAFSDVLPLQNYLKTDLNIESVVVDQMDKATIVIQKNDRVTNPEGYLLRIANNKIEIEASTETGAFYALQTLRQLWLQNRQLPSLIIQDAPRFKYRGVLIDTARHFFSIDEIKKLIDVMAAQKLNTLHIHFSDDEGWRLALPTFSTDVLNAAHTRGFVLGASNTPAVFPQANLDKTNYLHEKPTSNPSDLIVSAYPTANASYQGLYTQEEIKNLVAYANQQKITIIPEVDFPGHAAAIVQANPAVFVDSKDKSTYLSVQGYYNDVIPICLYGSSNDFTKTMNSLVVAISKLFANQTTLYYQNEVSLGADEVSADAWSSDMTCSSDPHWAKLSALSKSHFFFQRIAAANAPIKISGFQQLVQNNDASIDLLSLQPTSAGHVWAWNPIQTGGDKQAVALAQHHYPTIFSLANDLYFDLSYTPDAWEPGYNWAGSFIDTHAALNSAKDVENILASLGDNQQYISGLEGSLWSENLMNFKHLAYMALPKMTGLAEAAWSNHAMRDGQLNWRSLATRLGTDKNGFLHYLYTITGLQYRGYPHGIALEIPN